MNIKDLKTNQGNVEVEGVISELGDTRVFNKYGKELKVANAIFKDDSGAIKLTLWNDDITRFKEGDRIKIINGYVTEFQGEKQITSGKFGRMEKVVGEGNSDEKENVNEDATQEIKTELSLTDAKSKKAIVSKRDLKKKNEEDIDVYSEEVDEVPEEEKPVEEN